MTVAPVVPALLDLDLDRVGRRLEPCAGSGVDLSRLQVAFVKLSTDGPVAALLEAPSSGGQTAAFTARWVELSKGRRWENTLCERAGARGGPLRPAVYAPELGLLLSAYPFDRRLPSLARLADPICMAFHLSAAIAPASAVELRRVRYKPESKCVFEMKVTWAEEPRAGPELIYAKVSKRSLFERTVANGAAFDELRAGTGFAIPRLISTLGDLNLELWSGLQGRPIEHIVGTSDNQALGSAAGRALRSLHELPVDLPRAATAADARALVTNNAAQFARYLPSEATTAAGLAAEICARIGDERHGPRRPTHHDFHGGNILFGEGRPGLVDFEDLAMGDPADDVGSLYAHLLEVAVRRPELAPRLATERRDFLDAYDIGDLGPRFETRAAMHSLLLAYQALRYPGTTSGPLAKTMLAHGEQLLSGVLP